ncbi:hypothetical protein O9992_28605 [Vibrio lentus]|nr:hypothetical protein [Vibrio lentus]
MDTSLKRFYPNGEVLTHVLGYVAHINDSDLRKPSRNKERSQLMLTTIIGKLGGRALLRRFVAWPKGYQEVEVNSRGRAS